jgi:hypothetical protein
MIAEEVERNTFGVGVRRKAYMASQETANTRAPSVTKLS